MYNPSMPDESRLSRRRTLLGLASAPLFAPAALAAGDASTPRPFRVAVPQRQIDRILKTGGLFLVFHLPNRYSWIESLVRLLNRWKGRQKHAHSRLFTLGEFKRLLEGTSFEILQSGRYNFIPRNSFNRIPGTLSNQRWFYHLVNTFDDVLAWICPGLCQNWFFILRKNSRHVVDGHD